MSDPGPAAPDAGLERLEYVVADPVAPAAAPAPVFYRIDSPHVSFREYWWSSKSPAVLLGWISKVFRIKLSSSTDDLPVESLRPFEAGGVEVFPADVRAAFAPLADELAAAGFVAPPVVHDVTDAIHHTRTCLATYRHRDGRAVARIHDRHWSYPHPPKRFRFVEFLSEFADGTFLWTTSAKADMAWPRSCRLIRRVGALPAALWASHEAELRKLGAGGRRVVPVTDDEWVRALIERHHATVRDFHLRRGAFQLMTDTDRRQAHDDAQLRADATAAGLQHPDVLAEIDRLQRKPAAGWKRAWLVLLISLVLFVALGAAAWEWQFVAFLVPVLLFHELGHYVAMRAFHYRNLRMFLIPMLGAAVTGRNFNVAGWKKAVVFLMGPVPGIVLGVFLGMLGLIVGHDVLFRAAVLLVLFNGFNLLPVLPLDGGWLMHAVVFCRHHLLDVTFRAGAALALVAAGALIRDGFLIAIGCVMLLAVRPAYRLARVTHELRRSGFAPAVATNVNGNGHANGESAADDQTIPPAAAGVIVGRLKEAFPKGLTNKSLAQYALQVFERLNARPPRWPAALGLLGVYAASLAVVLFVGVMAAGGPQGVRRLARLGHDRGRYGPPLANVLTAGDLAPAPVVSEREVSTVVGTFPNAAAAEATLQDVRGALPAGASASRFGQTLFVALPAADAGARDRWVGEFDRRIGSEERVFVEGRVQRAGLALTCVAPDEATARAIEEEVEEYDRLPRSLWLIPPWLSPDPRTPAERERHRLARRTYRQLSEAAQSAYGRPEWSAHQEELRQATRRGDAAAVARLNEAEKLLLARLRRAAAAEARARDAARMDAALADAYLACLEAGDDPDEFAARGNGDTLDPAARKARRESARRVAAALGPYLGQLRLTTDGRPAPGPAAGVALSAGRGNWVGHDGARLDFRRFAFRHAAAGAPALAAWLASRDCTDFRYEFEPSTDAVTGGDTTGDEPAQPDEAELPGG